MRIKIIKESLAIGLSSFARQFSASLMSIILNKSLALLISMLRQIVVLIPLMIILPLFFGLNGLYFSFPIADFIAVFITFFVFRYSYVRL